MSRGPRDSNQPDDSEGPGGGTVRAREHAGHAGGAFDIASGSRAPNGKAGEWGNSRLAENEGNVMGKLTRPMIRLIENFTAGFVATTNADGTPAVSPKGTFVVVDEGCIAFGNIRSPATVENLRARPDVEVNFIDVLARRSVRVRGRAQVVGIGSEAAQPLLPAFREHWAEYMEHMSDLVSISVAHAELILSPAYDFGHTAEELRRVYLDRLSDLCREPE